MNCKKIEINNINLHHQESAYANSIRGVSSHNSSQASVAVERGVPSLDETIVSSHNTSDSSVASESVSTLSSSTFSNSPRINVRSFGRTVQCLIDEEIESMKVWKGELCLDVHLNGAVNVERVNVLEYIGLKDSLQSLRFCSKTFPVDPLFANIG